MPLGRSLLNRFDQGWIEELSINMTKSFSLILGKIGVFFQLNTLKIHFLRFIFLIIIIFSFNVCLNSLKLKRSIEAAKMN